MSNVTTRGAIFLVIIVRGSHVHVSLGTDKTCAYHEEYGSIIDIFLGTIHVTCRFDTYECSR